MEYILKQYAGCGNCEKCDNVFDCKAHTIPVDIEFLKEEKWDNWGHMVTAFRKGDKVRGYAVAEGNTIFCASAESTIYEGITDFIDLKNVHITAAGDAEEIVWLSWENAEEWGTIQCLMLNDRMVMTYYQKGVPVYYSYTAPFVLDGKVYYYRYDHDEWGWDGDVLFSLGEYEDGMAYRFDD